MCTPFGLPRSRPSRPCCDPVGVGRAGRTAQRPQQRGGPEGAKNLLREEGVQRRGIFFAPEGCGHRARGAAAPSPGFTTNQGRIGPTRPKRGNGLPGIPRHSDTGIRCHPFTSVHGPGHTRNVLHPSQPMLQLGPDSHARQASPALVIHTRSRFMPHHQHRGLPGNTQPVTARWIRSRHVAFARVGIQD